jgi:glyoxylase I family protein
MPMPRLKHIAISTHDVEKTARFYVEVFGMKELARIEDPNTTGCFLSDGHINLALLHFKNDVAAGAERGKAYTGIHHMGFEVEDMGIIAEKLAAAGATPRDDINKALGVGHGHRARNVEIKYTGHDGVTIDVSETGWIGTSGGAE